MTLAVGDARPQSDTPAVPQHLAGTAAARVLAELHRLAPGGGDRFEVRVGQLARRLPASERTVQRAIKALRSAGVIDVEEIRGGVSRFALPVR